MMDTTNDTLKCIKSFITRKKNYFTDHALTAMDERQIKSNDLINILVDDEIIENYPDSKPCPSCLILGYRNRKTIHVVIAICKEHIRIITTYEPNKNEWIQDKIRREKKSD